MTAAADAPRPPVVVIGAGAAGLSAAVAALEAGAAGVVVLEKAPIAGGHALVSSGSVAVAFPRKGETIPLQEAALMAEEIRRFGGPDADPALARILALGSWDAYLWLAGLGLTWSNERFRAVGSPSTRNVYSGTSRAGYDYVQILSQAARRLGAQLRFRTKALALISGSRGTEGVLVRRPDGRLEAVAASAVVIASGGFAASREMRARYLPHIPLDMPCTANPNGTLLDGAQGDGIRMAQAAGAALVGMQHVQIVPFSGGRLLDYVGGEIWINSLGRRFVPEGVVFSEFFEALKRQPGQVMWAISDSKSRKGATLGVKLEQGIVRSASSIEEMAAGMDMPAAALRRTIERYNAGVRAGRDLTFGVPAVGAQIDTPPYYYGKELLSLHFTCGGIRINGHAQALDVKGRALAGLFAAGETTGGIHGRDRLAGNSLTSCFVFGRIAGQSAAAWQKNLAG